MTSLTPEWRQWIEFNLLRNCTIRTMVEEMVAKNFDAISAAAYIATVSAELRTTTAERIEKPDGTFQYEDSRLPSGVSVQTHDRSVSVRMRIDRPEIVLLEDVFSREECEELIDRARKKLAPSTAVDRGSGEMKTVHDRTSAGTYFPLEFDPFIARLDRRLAEIAHWPLDHSEGIQILRYSVGGEYKPHFDYFPPEQSGSAVHTAHGGQRIATIIVYLNNVEAGGETIFPKVSLSIRPRVGDAVYFGYCNTQGQVDPMTLHGGAPVREGEKWIATKWIRQHRRR